MSQSFINVKQDNAYKSLKKFKWESIPRLALITGINGSGKTQLLDMIYNELTPNYQHGMPFGVVQENKSIEIQLAHGKIDYIPILWRYKNEEPFSNKLREQPYESWSMKITSSTKKINELLKAYKQTVADYEVNNKECVSNEWIAENNPIKKLNDFLCQKRREYNRPEIDILTGYIFDDIDIHQIRHHAPSLEFNISLSKISKIVHLDSISSGEKIILYLLISMCLADFGELSLLLLDELDAHLNPALLRLYFDILTEISKKTQVIATTHSPILANLTPENSLFWMQDGRIIPKDKKNILNTLADGLFTANDIQGILRLFQKDYNIPSLVILCEGVDDEITLRKWFSNHDKVSIIDCKGANNMSTFVQLPYSTHSKPIIVCLLDNDSKGQSVKMQIDNMMHGNNVRTMFVSQTTGDRMEEVLADNIKLTQLKDDIQGLITNP